MILVKICIFTTVLSFVGLVVLRIYFSDMKRNNKIEFMKMYNNEKKYPKWTYLVPVLQIFSVIGWIACLFWYLFLR
jgi:hypothetical protein